MTKSSVEGIKYLAEGKLARQIRTEGRDCRKTERNKILLLFED